VNLRRAAVVQIFELAGLSVVPGQFWQFLGRNPAPADAVIEFLVALGLDVDLLRRGDIDEVERANDVLDVLVEVDGAFSRLSDSARADVQSALFCGEYDHVREIAQVVKTYSTILELGELFPAGNRFAAFTEFLSDIASELENPMSASAADAAAAERLRLKMSELLRRLADARVEQERLVRSMWSDFPDWHSSTSAAAITLALSLFGETLESIQSRPNSLGDVAVLLDFLEQRNDQLRTLLFGLASGRGRTHSHGAKGGHSSRAYKKPGETALEIALKYFGLRLNSRPSMLEFKTIKRRYQRKTHPDSGGSNQAFIEFTRHCQMVEDHFAPAWSS
jgi:signal transduction histidine kinase